MENDSLNATDPWGLETQFSIGLNGAATLHLVHQCLALLSVQFRHLTRSLAVDQARRPVCIEMHHPIPNHLKPDPTQLRRAAPRLPPS